MRLKNLNLTTLETRRISGDLIEVYSIMNGIEAIDWKLLFSKAPHDGTTRTHTPECHTPHYRKPCHQTSQQYPQHYTTAPHATQHTHSTQITFP